MSVFRFKRFEVVNERSAMKVNTDGVLLGAAMTIRPEDRTFLDVGTGTGTIALMVAQRAMEDGFFSHAHNDIRRNARYDEGNSRNNAQRDNLHIDAIDIDGISAEEAAANFRNSPWGAALHAHHISLDAFAETAPDRMYDLIFSNPPYFDCSLQAPQERRNAARHTSTGLSYRELLEFSTLRLTPHGRVAIVLPADQEADLTRYARMYGLHLRRILRIRTVPRKVPSRIIAEFSHERCQQPSDDTLTIQNEGKYTEEYLSLTHEFYLFA